MTICPLCAGPLFVCHGVHGPVTLLPCVDCGRPLSVCRGRCSRPDLDGTTRVAWRDPRDLDTP
jgi:hypothetical protein